MKTQPSTSWSAIALATALGFVAPSTWAHGDEDHGHDSPPVATAPRTADAGAVSAAATRPSDGSLFIPKAVQRQLGIRTVMAQMGDLAASVELNGRVVADPHAGGRVQASQAGRIEGGTKGLPVLGQKVSKGQVLLWLRPTLGSIERGNQRSSLAEIEAQLAVAERKSARYAQLEGAVPQKDIDTARNELEALRQRRTAVRGSLVEAEALLAPVTGVISASNVANGQVVEAREVLLEIVDPQHLGVEALAYDPALVDGPRSASVQLPDGALKLEFVGGGLQLREQALPLLFRIASPHARVALGQSVKVIAQTAHTTKGAAVPLAALSRNSAGETVVWVHAGPERFVQRRVSIQALDGDTAAVTSGIAHGERIVGVGASLLAQVR